MNVLTDTFCNGCQKPASVAVEFCGDGDVVCPDCLRAALSYMSEPGPSREELIKAAATYLQGNWDDADRECIAFFIEQWLKNNNLIAVQVSERPGSSFTKTEIQQAKTK